ncbi:hypothetical protein P4O66_010560, partial [Electrophorus voltai]
MALRGVYCILALQACVVYSFLHAGVCFCEEVLLPKSYNEAVNDKVLFTPIKLPSQPFDEVIWAFGLTRIILFSGTQTFIDSSYTNRASLNTTSFAMELRNLNMIDAGEYKITIKKKENSLFETTTLNVFDGPDKATVAAAPVGPFYSSGCDIMLRCSAEASPAAVFQWVASGTVLGEKGPELKLANIQTNQSGSYTCLAHNTKSLRYSTSEPINIIVVEKISQVTLNDSTGLLIEGRSFSNLTCEGSGTILSTEWMKDYQILSPSNSVIFSPDNKTVLIGPVRRSDSGEYQCTLSNPVSSDTAKFIMTVNYGPDKVVIGGPSEVEVQAKALTFECITESIPTASYTWEFNGTNTGVTTVSFIVELVHFENSGKYTCIAQNHVTKLNASGSHALVVKAPLRHINIDVYFLTSTATGNGKHELTYTDIKHFQNNQTMVNMGGTNAQMQHETLAMVRALILSQHNQGSSSIVMKYKMVSSLISNFGKYCKDWHQAESGWNPTALMDAFHQGLSEDLKDELAHQNTSTSLYILIDLVLRIDSRIRERRRARGPDVSQGSCGAPRTLSPVHVSDKQGDSGLRPMQLGHTCLSRRAAGNFLNSGLANKLALPLVPLDEPLSIAAIDGQSLEPGVVSHPTRPVILTAPIKGQHGDFGGRLQVLQGQPLLCTAKTAIGEGDKVLLTQVVRLHGLPSDIVSEHGPQLISHFCRAFCRLLGAEASLSSGFHPQSNDQTERVNQDLERTLRCLASSCPSSWSEHLLWADFAHNTLWHSSLVMSPFACQYGYAVLYGFMQYWTVIVTCIVTDKDQKYHVSSIRWVTVIIGYVIVTPTGPNQVELGVESQFICDAKCGVDCTVQWALHAGVYPVTLVPSSNPVAAGGNVTLTLNPATNIEAGNWLFENNVMVFWYPGNFILEGSSPGRVSFNSSSLQLSLCFLQVNDSGRYTLQGAIPPLRAEVALSVQEPITNVSLAVSQTNLVEFNDSVTVTCSAHGTPLEFSWRNRSSELTSGGSVQLSSDGRILTITNLTRYDQGPFTCIVANGISNGTSGTIYLKISYPVSFATVLPSSNQPIFNMSFTLSCDIIGPVDSTYWEKNGLYLHSDSRIFLSNQNKTLTLTQLTLPDDGDYQCVASNSVSNMTSGSYRLMVNYGPWNTSVSGPAIAAVLSSVSLNCCASSQPPSEYTWYFNGSKVAEGTTYMTGALSLNNSGEYTCITYNNITSRSGKATWNLSVIDIISSAMVLPSSNQPIFNMSFILSCDIVGPVDSTYWEKNGLYLHSDSRIFLSNKNKTLTLTQLTLSDDGDYQCVASNSVSNMTSGSYRLIVNYGPWSSTISGPDIAEVGSSVTLNCSAPSRPPCEYTWYFSGSNVAKGPVFETGVLSLNSSGQYTCMAHNNITNRSSSATWNLTVIEGIYSVVVTPSMLIPLASKDLQLFCNITGFYSSIQWLKDGLKFNTTRTATVSMDNTTLAFQPLLIIDDGTYQCAAKNAIGNHVSKSYKLTANYGPVNLMITVEVGNDITLTCDAKSQPQSVYYWIVNNGTDVREGAKIIISMSALGNNYTCVARNPLTNVTLSGVYINS